MHASGVPWGRRPTTSPEATLDGTGVAFPVRVEATTSSRRQALTYLAAWAAWQPVLALGGFREQRSAGARAGLRLGEVAGRDVALVGSWSASEGAPLDEALGVTHEGTLGWVLERR